MKQYEAVIEAMVHLKVKANSETEARNQVIEALDKLKKSMSIDVSSLNIIEKKKAGK